MAKSSATVSPASKGRVVKAVQKADGGATVAGPAPKKPFNPLQFLREVRAEARKITWTSRNETWITSVMVMIMVVLTAVFFFVVDLALSFGINQILKLSTLGS
jgi:preprotein translocase subunit SecE